MGVVITKEVRLLKRGDIIRLSYGVEDNYVVFVVESAEIHTTWTKLHVRIQGRSKHITTWVYTDAVVEWLGEEKE